MGPSLPQKIMKGLMVLTNIQWSWVDNNIQKYVYMLRLSLQMVRSDSASWSPCSVLGEMYMSSACIPSTASLQVCQQSVPPTSSKTHSPVHRYKWNLMLNRKAVYVMRECLAAVTGLLGIIWHRHYLGHCLIPRLFYSPKWWGRCVVYSLPVSC